PAGYRRPPPRRVERRRAGKAPRTPGCLRIRSSSGHHLRMARPPWGGTGAAGTAGGPGGVRGGDAATGAPPGSGGVPASLGLLLAHHLALERREVVHEQLAFQVV